MKENSETKEEKEKFKFVCKVYLHLLGQSIIIFIMLIFAFKNTFFKKLLKENSIIFYTSLIIILVTFFQPLNLEKILKNKPHNFIYLFIFTLCISYIVCKIAILFNFELIMIIYSFIVLEIIYLALEYYFKKKVILSKTDITYSASNMGLSIICMGISICAMKEKNILNYWIVLIFLIALHVYLMYYMNFLVTDKRRNFKSTNSDYALVIVFFYFDIFQIILNLFKKICNCSNSEKKTVKEKTKQKRMIFVGEEDYNYLYKKESEKKTIKEKPNKKSKIFLGEEDYKHIYKKEPEEKDKNNDKKNSKINAVLKNITEDIIENEEEEENNNFDEKRMMKNLKKE